jgi:hypothetical protein
MIRVALLRGKWSSPGDASLMLLEMDSHVHAEVWVDDMGFSSGYNGKARSVFQAPRPGPADPTPKGWDVFPLPLSDEAPAVDIMRDMWRTEAPYKINARDFVLPRALVDRLDPDVDCARPQEWHSLFCSQFALLYLRRCALEGLLEDPDRILWQLNSRSCAPSHLARLLPPLLAAQRPSARQASR